MMKSILYLCILSSLLLVALAGKHAFPRMERMEKREQQLCTVHSCSKRGDECGITVGRFEAYFNECLNEADECIASEQGSNYQRGICTPKLTAGAVCSDEDDTVMGTCGRGLYCDDFAFNSTYTCVPTRQVTQEAGEYCDGTAKYMCRFPSLGDSGENENVCSNNVCKFIADGQPCDDDDQCNRATNSRCKFEDFMSDTGICFNSNIPLNGACNLNRTDYELYNADDCVEGTSCVPLSVSSFLGTCETVYSVKKGKSCASDEQCDKGYCAPPESEDNFGECADFRKTSTRGKRCVDNNDCTASNGEFCVCTGDDVEDVKCLVQEYSSKDYETFNKLEQCAIRNSPKCGYYEEDGNHECIIDACKDLFCDTYKFYKITGSDAPLGYNKCEAVQACDASAIFASLPIMIVLALAVMLFQ